MLKLATTEPDAGAMAPPNDIAAEMAVLGAILIVPSSLDEVAATLLTDDFFLPAHREIFEAMVFLAKADKPLDVVTLADELKIRDMLKRLDGQEQYLLKLANVVPTASNVGHYARIVKAKSIKRRLILACAEAMSRAYGDQDLDEILGEHRRAVAGLEAGEQGGPKRLGDGLLGALEAMEAKCSEPERYAVRTGIQAFDERIGGFKAGQQIVVASNPGQGKTAWAWTTSIRAAMAGIPVLVFSLEMKFQEMAERAVAFSAVVRADKINAGRVTFDEFRQMREATKRLGSLPLWLDDRKVNMRTLASEARRWRHRYASSGQAMVVVDYLGLVKADRRGENRNLEVGEMSRSLKILAGDLDCPVVVVAQLNRDNMKGGEGGKPRKPVLSDLRDSGEVEQNADMVIFPWRESGSAPQDAPQEAWLIVAKHRNGPTGKIPVEWDGRYMAFYDSDQRQEDARG
jgi:replicative DNA helicase